MVGVDVGGAVGVSVGGGVKTDEVITTLSKVAAAGLYDELPNLLDMNHTGTSVSSSTSSVGSRAQLVLQLVSSAGTSMVTDESDMLKVMVMWYWTPVVISPKPVSI